MSSPVHVAVAAIIDPDDRVLITLRHQNSHQGGLWEFPGGKVEQGESVLQALHREIEEEVGLVVEKAEPLIRIHHDYSDKQVLLDVWSVTKFSGVARGRESQEWQWVEKDKLTSYSFPAANLPIIQAVQLPDYYLITPEPGKDKSLYLRQLEGALKQGIELVQFRAKSLPDTDYRNMAADVLGVCRENAARLILNANVDMLEHVPADGIHLTSARLLQYQARPLGSRYLISASCHNEQQIKLAERSHMDFAVVAPVLATTSHPQVKPLGWAEFNRLATAARIPCYALGGMSIHHASRSRELGGQGIAAISSLWGDAPK